MLYVETTEIPKLPNEESSLTNSMMNRGPPGRCLTIRLYMEGSYPDPPSGVVPPLLLTPGPPAAETKPTSEGDKWKDHPHSSVCAIL